MKSCPTCHRTYPDDTLAFCLIDGSVLSAPYAPPVTHQRANEPPPTEILHSLPSRPETSPSRLQPTMPVNPPVYATARQPDPTKSNSPGKWVAVGIAAFVLLIAGMVVVLVGTAWLGSRKSTDRKSELKSNVPASTNTSESTPLPDNTPSPAKLDVAGRWVGISDGSPASLVIKSSENDSYEGIETAGLAKVKIAVEVQVDPETRHITINETRILEGEGGWNLGINNGTISTSGNKMSGRAKDVKGKTYSWSFTRQ